ncbi:hypothetical protein LTR56_003222 [Elasticomyces elasticus]|nr:hypothetical protein LTR22_017792 [Elasticomyces elasticus]KAK3656090.1 hypothetical protein LTR56_003222 [Elasticomyces elasticus]KAK4922355.1 hypothetical protein LTR49_010386 [Elasticomyces elasticus]KAK5763809.1 hypothetical protein LTS12_006143 [Elasticomyces elasticus]
MAKKKVTTVVKPTSQRASARLTKKDKPVYVAEDDSEDEIEVNVKVKPAQEVTEDEAVIEAAPKFKEYIDEFSGPVDPDKDFISKMPPEVLDNILGYCIRDHEPEVAARHEAEGTSAKIRPHALISMAAMSKLFRDCVENLSYRGLIRDPASSYFKTTAEKEAALPEKRKPTRRSGRLSTLPAQDRRIYRMEFLRYLRICCVDCSTRCYDKSVLLNGVAMCAKCESERYGKILPLTDALKRYDLRDYMLIPTRKPGPRATHTDLPKITYGTVKIRTSVSAKTCTSYRFSTKDVEMIARVVHSDFKAHMAAKLKKKEDRQDEKLRALHIELKIRHHTWAIAVAGTNKPVNDFHRRRLEEYKNPNWDGEWREEVEDWDSYGEHWTDVHERICKIRPCEDCLDRKEEQRSMRFFPRSWWD